MAGERLVNHGAIDGAYGTVCGCASELESSRALIRNMGEFVLASWNGKSSTAFEYVNKETHAFFGALIDGLNSMNDGLCAANRNFETEDGKIAGKYTEG